MDFIKEYQPISQYKTSDAIKALLHYGHLPNLRMKYQALFSILILTHIVT